MPAQTPAPVEIAEKIANAQASEKSGTFLYRFRSTYRMNGAGLASRTEESDVLLSDGVVVAERTLRRAALTYNGKPYRLPINPQWVHDYSYNSPRACSECKDGAMLLDFKSNVRDRQHGSGTLQFDERTGRVSKIEFVPSVMPFNRDSGFVLMIFGEGPAGRWLVQRVEQHYLTHFLLIIGKVDEVANYENYRWFSTRQDGQAAFDAIVGANTMRAH